MDDELIMEIVEMCDDILASRRFEKAWQVPHHSKGGNIAYHSLETAGYALQLARWLAGHDVLANELDVVRASLLHDIGMTEDSVFFSASHQKARSHPKVGAQIARDEFGANQAQIEAILSHMWPVFRLVPPCSVEGWIVSAADKQCSFFELRRSVASTGRRLLGIFRLFERLDG